MALLYDYTVSGSDKANIDTGVDTPQAGSAGTGAFPATYPVLVVWLLIRTDEAAATGVVVDVTLNNDTSAIYDRQRLSGANATVSAATTLARTAWPIAIHGNGGSVSYAGVSRLSIPGYASTTFWKVAELTSVSPDATAGNNVAEPQALGYRATTAITRLKVAAAAGQNLKVGSRLLIYGG